MSEKIKIGDHTNAGFVLFVDEVSALVPDPICRVSSTNLCSHRLSELHLVPLPPKPPEPEVDLPESFPLDHARKLLAGMADHVRRHGFGGHSTSWQVANSWLNEKFKK